MDKYIFLDELIPGDAIFSADRSFMSKAIRLLTLSRYHHVAIVVAPNIWVESTPEGIRFKVVPYQWVDDDRNIRFGYKIPNGTSMGVFRLKSIMKIFDSNSCDMYEYFMKLSSSVLSAIQPFYGLDYANLGAFRRVSPILIPKILLENRLTKYFDPRNDDFIPGPFCSHLAAAILRKLGADIHGVNDAQISPGRLIRSDLLSNISQGTTANEASIPDKFLNQLKYINEIYTHLQAEKAMSSNIIAIKKAITKSDIASQKLNNSADNMRSIFESALQRETPKMIPFDTDNVALENKSLLMREIYIHNKDIDKRIISFCSNIFSIHEQVKAINLCRSICNPNRKCYSSDIRQCERLDTAISNSAEAFLRFLSDTR